MPVTVVVERAAWVPVRGQRLSHGQWRRWGPGAVHGAAATPAVAASVSRDVLCVLSHPASTCTTRNAHLGPGGEQLQLTAGVEPSAGVLGLFCRSFEIGKSCLERHPTGDVIGGFRGGEWGVAGLSKVGCED
jgi:hypothetical protein